MRLNRDVFGACISKIAAQAGVNADQAFGIIQQVADYGDKLRQTGEANPFETAAAAIAEREKKGAIEARTDALRNALKRDDITRRIDAEGGIGTAADTLRSILHWSPKAKDNNNIESQWHGLSKLWQATVGNVLHQTSLEKAAISGALDHEIGEAWWRLNGGQPDKTVEVSAPAKTIAEALHPALKLARERLNNAGAHIGDAVDYVTHTNWNPRQLRLAAGPGASMDQAFAAWWAKEEPRMADKTFEHLVPKDGETMEQAKARFGRSVFDATVSGVHLTSPHLSGMADDGGGYIPPAFEGTRNVGRKLSQQRTIYWKDARSWVDHMRDFGGGDSIYAQSMRSLDGAARRTALMDKLGTNPQANFNSIVRSVREKYRGDPEGLKAFDANINGDISHYSLDTALSYLDGRANIPANADWADRINQVLTWEATSKLGGVSVTHLTTAPMTISAEMAHHGVSRLDSIGNVLKAIVTGRGSAEKQDALAEAGAYAQGYNLMIGTRLQLDRGIPGYISWAATQFMRLTGLDHFLGRLQADGVKSVLMTKLGRSADKTFDALDPNQASIMRRYGLGPDEWDLLRNTPANLSIEGQRYITPKAASQVNDADAEALLRRQGLIGTEADPDTIARSLQRFKWELGDKYLMYLNDASERATVTPGVRERSILLRGAQPGTIGWAAGRALAQFKMWPLAAWNQIVNREIGYSLSRGQAAANFGWILALSTAGGALRMAVNDAVNGRPQRNFMSPAGLTAALAQGGGLGIYGDFLFGETSRFGNSPLVTAAGPVAGDVESLLKIYGKFRDDISDDDPDVRAKAVQHMWPELARQTVAHIPFANLIYIKGALDYLAFYHMYEAASPGWWDRTNRRLEKEQGRSMAGYVPGAGVPWGVPGLNIQTQPAQQLTATSN